MYKLEGIVLLFNIVLIGLMCYMCVNYSLWWLLLLFLSKNVESENRKDEVKMNNTVNDKPEQKNYIIDEEGNYHEM